MGSRGRLGGTRGRMLGSPGGRLVTPPLLGQSLEFEFSGTAVRRVSTLGPARGLAEVRIDGALVETVDTYAASYAHQRRVFSRSGPSSGVHTVTITFSGVSELAASGASIVVDAVETDGTAVASDA